MKSLSNFKFVNYEFDLNSVLNTCDILISDYSGVIFDYLLLDRPIIIYAPDYNDYYKKGFNLDPTKEDFCYTAKNFNELLKLISIFSKDEKDFVNKHSKNRKKIKNKVFLEINIDKLTKLVTD